MGTVHGKPRKGRTEVAPNPQGCTTTKGPAPVCVEQARQGPSKPETVPRENAGRRHLCSRMTGVYEPKPFIPHAASLHQACAHCEKFSTAATRRCLDRVSVPVWLVVLSDQLPVLALVGFYPAN
ncbi:unnamed protein product [Oikopleura dioica]|uniref:Uncharacterized protein n=1 Tax=Oikopleura dioica TaxID=34765 RepID=E4XWU9_OIKDI|nr:unnamed protein product [Oikopleura dioica]